MLVTPAIPETFTWAEAAEYCVSKYDASLPIFRDYMKLGSFHQSPQGLKGWQKAVARISSMPF